MTELTETNSPQNARETLTRIFAKTRRFQRGADYPLTLSADWHDTPVGPVFLVADEEKLNLLGFITEEAPMVRKIALIEKKIKANIELASTPAIIRAKQELDEYFAGQRRTFDVPLALNGTAFQIAVWETLRQIPYGQTASYAELAQKIGRPSAFRAVAQANSQNPIAIIVPCHRVINTDGALGGYNGGIDVKTQLLEFEKEMLKKADNTE